MKLATLFKIIITVNILGLILIYATLSQVKEQSKTKTDSPLSKLGFHRPIMAYHLLRRFDVFEPVPQNYYDMFSPPLNRFKEPKLGLNRQDDYCDQVRAFTIDHAAHPFFENNIFTDHKLGSVLRRDTIPQIGFDSMMEINPRMGKVLKMSRVFNLKPNIMNFFTRQVLHPFQHLGRNFACTFQMYNHIPGDGYLSRSDRVQAQINEYLREYTDRPQCINHQNLFLRSWVLNRETQCIDFFYNYFDGDKYLDIKKSNNIVYIRKNGNSYKKHQSFPVNETEEIKLREMYQNGSLCGRVRNPYMIQFFIPNPFLIYSHKFDIRSYMLIASVNPLLAYYYDGFLKIALNVYDPLSTDRKMLLNHPKLSREILHRAKRGEIIYGMNETDLLNFQSWTYEKLHEYLWTNQRIFDPFWTQTYLRRNMRLAMIHLLRATSEKFLVRSQVYSLVAVDFFLDDELKLWFMDANPNPVLEGDADWKKGFFNKLLIDTFEITLGLRRVKDFINFVCLETSGDEMNGFLFIPDFPQKLAEFKRISSNYFERDLSPGLLNKFEKIVDNSVEGTARYGGLLTEDCL
jgi:Tubulin-tyrosine ligase family